MSAFRLEYIIRMAAPQLLLVLFLLLGFVTVPLSYASSVKPSFVLMGIYYWAIFRPTLVPAAVCFLCGLFTDILAGMPLGLNALCYVAVQWIVSDQRRFLMGQPYITLWGGFGLVVGAMVLAQWGLYSMVLYKTLPLWPLLGAWAANMLLFPFVTLLLIMVHKILPVASRPLP